MSEVPKSIRASLYIDGKPAEASLKNLKSVTQTLRRDLDGLTVGTEQWQRAMRNLQVHERNLRNIQNEVRGVGGAFGWLKTELGKLGALAIGYLGFQFVTDQFQNIIMANAKLSDSLADMRRVAGLTEREVLNLNKSFKDLDTRTSTAGLRDIAIIAGKLGVAKGEILGFTEAVDKLVVTLGDELGNADQITTNLGKILNVYDGKVTGENITNLGNAMVVMANAGVASGGFIADFTQRVSGIAVSAHLSLGATVGLAAGLEELGGKVDSSSTAVQRLLGDIAADLPKAANIAKQSLGDFQKLFDTAPEKALLAYAAGLVKNKTAFSEVSASFKDAGEEGQRVISTLAALGNKAEFMQGKIDLGNQSLKEQAAINAGFALKNETFGASVDKLSKKFTQLTASNGVSGFFQSLILLTTKAIDGLIKHGAAIGSLIKMVVVAGVAWSTYKIYLAAANSQMLAFTVSLIKGETVMALSRTSTIALSGVTALFSGNIAKATRAARLLNLTLLENPIGLVIAALVAAAAAYALLSISADDATQKLVANAAKLTKAALEQKNSVKLLEENISPLLKRYDELKNKSKLTTAEQTELKAIIAQIAKTIPDAVTGFNQYGNAMDINSDKAKKFLDAQKAMLRYQNKEAIKENIAARNELTARQKNLVADLNRGTETTTLNLGTGGASSSTRVYTAAEKAAKQKEIHDIVMQKKEIDDAVTGLSGSYLDLTKPTTPVVKEETVIAKTVGERRKAIEGEINKLKIAYDNLAATDKAGQAKNRAQRDAFQKELDSLDGTKSNGDAKKAENVQKSSRDLTQIIKKFNAQQLADQMNTNKKEVEEAKNKYQDLIDLEIKWKSDHPKATKAQTDTRDAEIGKLEAEQKKTTDAIKLRQEKDLIDKIKELRVSLGTDYDTELRKEEDRINAFYDDRLKKGDNWKLVEAGRAKDLTDAKIREEQRFQDTVDDIHADGVVTEAEKEDLRKARINKKYDDEILALKKKFSKELQATKAFQEAIDAINKNRDNEIKQKTKVSEEEKSKAIEQAAIQGAQDLANGLFEISRSNRQAETDAELSKLNKEKDRLLANKDLTEAQRTAITEKYSKKEREIKLKAWEADKAASLQQAEINTIVAVTKAMTSAIWPLNLIAAAGAALAGGIEVAKISSMKPPEFAGGGMSNEDPAGYVGQATIFKNSASGRPFVAGEAGREWIAPNWMLQNPRTANIIGMLESARKEKRAFAGGGFNSSAAAAPAMAPSSSRLDRVEELLVKFIDKQAQINAIPVVNDRRAQDIKDARNAEIRRAANAG